MHQAVSRLSLTAEERVCARFSPCAICDIQSGTGIGFVSEFFGFSCQYHLANEK
jgi:hypothetical protein